jgi:hypothetical protein
MLEPAILDASWIEEPRLVFGNGKLHENPKVGIPLYGPRSYGTPRHKNEIHIGFIGEGDSIQHAQEYIAACCEGVEGESYHYAFPGCSADMSYRFTPRFSSTLVEKVTQTEKAALQKQKSPRQRFEDSVSLFLSKLELLCGKDHPLDYVMLVMSEELYEVIRAADYGDGNGLIHRDFRRAFKAGAMKFRKPTQLFRESTIGRSKRQLDNPATRAWNLFTGMYFKVGGLPWGPFGLKPSTCHVGVSFYRPLGEPSSIRASAARAFDENGEGLVLRGQRFEWDEEKMGRSPHLPAEHAARLVDDVLSLYQTERHHLPQRVMIHKTSAFAPAEREGFTSALKRVSEYDLVSIFPTSNIRLLRTGKYPPLRGTILNIEDEHYLYTTGYMPTISSFPHGHVPSPLRIVDHVGDTSIKDILQEILILSKMNWNSANMDGLLPITLTFSRIVGDILREVPTDVTPDPRYIFYM